mmetsp:Transcript_2714/g.3887  ORF Transcript_2714/g.3887 Transcript_2714/m.3887 type:complete len:296 (+) Transcript_2714:68-955(+)
MLLRSLSVASRSSLRPGVVSSVRGASGWSVAGRNASGVRSGARVARGRKRFSTSAKEAAGDAGKTAESTVQGAVEEAESSSMTPKIVGFVAFLLVGGVGTFGYMISTDEDFLFKMRDEYPSVVNLIAPWFGLPVDEESGELKVEEYFPRSITDLVGDTVPVACILRSGRVVTVNVPADSTLAVIDHALLEKLGVDSLEADPVVNFSFLDQDAEVSDDSGEQTLVVSSNLPVIPPAGTASREQLNHLLNVYRLRELDAKTNLELARQYGEDQSQTLRTLNEIEEGKVRLKTMIKRL